LPFEISLCFEPSAPMMKIWSASKGGRVDWKIRCFSSNDQ